MIQDITLNTGVRVPIIGFGTWKLVGADAERAVREALEVGYWHIDTADCYGNHREIAKAIKASGLKREELFITSKVWTSDLAHETAMNACRRILEELEMPYLDLCLVHWPNRTIPIKTTMLALQELKDSSLIKAYGVSNFTIHHIQDILNIKDDLTSNFQIEIAMNQIEFHPSLYQKELVDFCHQNNIAVTACSPIAQGQDLEIPIIRELAQKYGRSESQVILNWIMQKGIVAIPKAAKREHMEDNLRALEWEMHPDDAALIDSLKLYNRIVNPAYAEFDH